MRSVDLYEARLDDAHFANCDLGDAKFSKARIAGARLQGSKLDTIHGADSLRGVVIDSSQIIPLALRVFGALEITIDDESDEDDDR